MKYELYHDESKENGYWHGMFLVPIETKVLLLDYLAQVRKNTRHYDPIAIKKVKRPNTKVFSCADSWLQVGIAAMLHKFKGQNYPIFLGKIDPHRKKVYEFLDQIIGAKFILFREKDNFKKMKFYSDYGSKFETTFRMGFKGGLHYLGNQDNPIEIQRIHFDGYEHYHRNVDRQRIIGRLNGLREYCLIENADHIIDDRSSNHTRPNSQDYNDCQLIQLTDLLIGAFRSALGFQTKNSHRKLSYITGIMIEKYLEGFARMQNSRWSSSFCMSQCYLKDDTWVFELITPENKPKNNQLSLFNCG